MQSIKIYWLFLFLLLNSSVFANNIQSGTQGSIVPDGSLLTTVCETGTVFKITGGVKKGTNLFHSFDKFNIDTSKTAKFSNDQPGITENIFSRVTGKNRSEIYGTIQANEDSGFPNVNFFLLNPAGITLGSEATLQIDGSVHFSTADYIHLQDGNIFYVDPNSDSTLTTANIRAFGFLKPENNMSSPSSILIEEDTVLEIEESKTLSLVGGDVVILESELTAPGGNINIISANYTDEVVLDSSSSVKILKQDSSPSASPKVDIIASTIDVSSKTIKKGSISIIGGKITIDDESEVSAGSSNGGNAGTIHIDAEQLFLSNESFIDVSDSGNNNSVVPETFEGGLISIKALIFALDEESEIAAGSSKGGSPGTVILDVEELTLSNESVIDASDLGRGNFEDSKFLNGGSITIKGIKVSLDEDSEITARGFRERKAGTINLAVEELSMSDGARIDVGATGSETAGNIYIDAKTKVKLAGNKTKVTAIHTGSNNAGNITIKTPTLEISQNAEISTSSASNNDKNPAGNINLKINSLTLEGSARISAATSNIGNGGTILIRGYNGDESSAETVILNQGQISTQTDFEGSSGNIDVKAKKIIVKNQGKITTDTTSNFENAGNAGNIILQTSKLTVQNNGVISSETSNDGNAGSINITAKDQTLVSNSGSISSKSTGTGNAGKINFKIAELKLDNGSITTEAAQSDGGDITIEGNSPAKLISLINSSAITATVTGGQATTGGNITIDSNLIVLQNSNIIAKASEGTGGNISIKAQGLFNDSNSQISASSQLGVDGTVEIDSVVEVIDGVLGLPDSYMSKLKLRQETCAKRLSGGKTSSFTVMEKSGMPISPETMLSADFSNYPVSEKNDVKEPIYINSQVPKSEQYAFGCQRRNVNPDG